MIEKEGTKSMSMTLFKTPNKSRELINYPAGNLSAHFKRCSFPLRVNEQRLG